MRAPKNLHEAEVHLAFEKLPEIAILYHLSGD